MTSFIRTLLKLISLSVFARKRQFLLMQKCLSELTFRFHKPFRGAMACIVGSPYLLNKSVDEDSRSVGVAERSVVVTQFDVEENIGHLMTLARVALEKGEVEKAMAILEMGIKICEEYQIYFVMPYIYDILAAVSFATGNLTKAEELLVQVLKTVFDTYST